MQPEDKAVSSRVSSYFVNRAFLPGILAGGIGTYLLKGKNISGPAKFVLISGRSCGMWMRINQ